MNSFELINVYEKVAQITADMLLAARANDWELLSQLEDNCSGQISTLKEFEGPTELPIELKTKKIMIIKQILADDRAIRDITEPWMQNLANLMKSSSTSRKLSQSYGANQIG
ncbi:flagellar protein FliT [Undibacterium sp. Ji22W]|uniref:flagellar protein FliT n=1 Tax=Undibacterium sp. Ji22W TaxID=3413038 RepID=UPI003BF0C9A7